MREEYSLLDDIKFELCNYENSTDEETTDEEWKDVFYDLLLRVVDHYSYDEGMDVVYLEDVTGILGEMLSADTSDIPDDALAHLGAAYDICVENL
jgi:hypothetical protein